MKLTTSFALLAAATAAPRLVQAASSLDNLMSLISQLELEAIALQTEYGGKDDEIASLIAQLTACEQGNSGEDASAPTPGPQPEPTARPTPAAAPEAVPESTPSPTAESTRSPVAESTPSPTAESTPLPTETADEEGDFAFSLGQSWNYNLASPVDTSVDVDVFFIDMDAGQEIIDELHGKGKGVVCYISIGTVEDWRDDKDDFPSSAIGGAVSGWAGEKWLDVNNEEVREIMTARVEMAASMKCDAVEPDNMMVYSESGTGVDVTEAQQIEYNTWFADEVHANGMYVGLKNTVELAPILSPKFDYALNEECHEWNECEVYQDSFLGQGKPVFNVEYNLGKAVCDEANALGLDTILKDYDLKAPLCSCVDSSRDKDCMF
ncbi:unnamed protein product [Scytosiphon promiscuus]